MNTAFYDIVVIFQWICIIGGAVFSFIFVSDKEHPKYLLNFHWYSIIAALTSVLAFLQKYLGFISTSTLGTSNNLLLLFHFTFLSVFIYKVLPDKKILKMFVSIFIALFTAVILSFYINDFKTRIPTAFAITNFGLVIFCSIYYFQLFEVMPTNNLTKEPSFWIVNGIFFCMCATIPVLALKYYIVNHISMTIFSKVEVIIPLAYGIMHLFFIKAYVCTINLRKV